MFVVLLSFSVDGRKETLRNRFSKSSNQCIDVYCHSDKDGDVLFPERR